MHIVAVIGSCRNAFCWDRWTNSCLCGISGVRKCYSLTFRVFISGSEGDLGWCYLAGNAD